jgi:GIY-YIG catalytic domain-containing protein
MELNNLLVEKGIDPKQVIVLRHRPFEPGLDKKLQFWADERPDLFEAYQMCHGLRLEKALVGASYVASFIAYGPGKALFVGLYRMKGSKTITFQQYWEIPAHREMKKHGMRGLAVEEGRATIQQFNLLLIEHYNHWKGKLVIGWPGIERSWWRWASRNHFPIQAIFDQSKLVDTQPSWDDLVLRWEDLNSIPSSWEIAFSQWRGVYYIFDDSDGKGYVGSACGRENILGRWRNYAATGHGGNSLLKRREPENFEFSILELVSPAMDRDHLIRLENSWKRRLHTQSPNGLNEN